MIRSYQDIGEEESTRVELWGACSVGGGMEGDAILNLNDKGHTAIFI